MTARDEAIAAAGRVFAEGLLATASMSVEQQAAAAFTPTGPSLAELEQRIRDDRRARRDLARPGAA